MSLQPTRLFKSEHFELNILMPCTSVEIIGAFKSLAGHILAVDQLV